MRFTLAQLNPTVGDIEGNLSRLLNTVKFASGEHSDLAIFPELYLCAYPPRDLVEYDSLIKELDKAVDEIVLFSGDYPEMGILFGSPRKNEGTGKGLFNSALLVCAGKLVSETHKCLLPTYDVFDEARHFDAATDVGTVPFKNEVLGISICEDAWNSPDILNQPIYSFDPIEKLAK